MKDYLNNKIPHVKFRCQKILELSHRVEAEVQNEMPGTHRERFTGAKGKEQIRMKRIKN